MARGNQNSAYKERNLEFLEEYASRDGVKVMFNGVMYREITKGKGDKPTPKAMITVHYTGKLINGKVFDSTQQGRPATFKLNQAYRWLAYRFARDACGVALGNCHPLQSWLWRQGCGSYKAFLDADFRCKVNFDRVGDNCRRSLFAMRWLRG